jgi:hypothetical protein
MSGMLAYTGYPSYVGGTGRKIEFQRQLSAKNVRLNPKHNKSKKGLGYASSERP